MVENGLGVQIVSVAAAAKSSPPHERRAVPKPAGEVRTRQHDRVDQDGPASPRGTAKPSSRRCHLGTVCEPRKHGVSERGSVNPIAERIPIRPSERIPERGHDQEQG